MSTEERTGEAGGKRVLALEPYYGGSHRQFLDGWIDRSAHRWTVLTLPATKWKWRMRHSAVTFSSEVTKLTSQGKQWDVLFCSDMLNLAEFRALAPAGVAHLPSVIYFHENQLTYPVIEENERDYHFVFSNMISALAAREVWFNSAFHCNSFLGALDKFLRRMPDYQPLGQVEQILAKAKVRSPCIDEFPVRAPRAPGPLRILWAARWEPDKAPDCFFDALKLLERGGVDFRISVIGGTASRISPSVFAEARELFESRIDRWGYQASREEYEAALGAADVIVSTAEHEFFGISVLEAVASGAFPLVPRRLAYADLFAGSDIAGKDSFFYEGGKNELARRLRALAEHVKRGDLWQGHEQRGLRVSGRYAWGKHISRWDAELAALADIK